MEFANFTLGKFRGVRFAGGTMRSVGFDECRFERVEFSLCDLTMAEFSRTRLKGLSFVDSDIRGIRVGDTGSFELKGLKVSALQASELARLLGLESRSNCYSKIYIILKNINKNVWKFVFRALPLSHLR